MSTATDKGDFIFREITTPDELLAAFRLRYEVYRDSRLKGFCAANDEGIDVDPWDACSRHFGLYERSTEGAILAGSIRVIESAGTSTPKIMTNLAECSRLIRSILAAKPESPFSLFTCGGDANKVREYLRLADLAGRRLVEPSRLVVLPQKRAIRLAVFLIECSVVMYFFGAYSPSTAILGCAASQKKVYQRYGFDNIPGTSDRFWEKPGLKAAALMATPDSVPETLRPRLRAMAREFDTTGRIIFRSGSSGSRRSGFRPAEGSQAGSQVA